MTNNTQTLDDIQSLDTEKFEELSKRVQDIDNAYRSVAEKMGQLYMFADENKLGSLTSGLDKPMRNASENEQMFAAILEDLRMVEARRG